MWDVDSVVMWDVDGVGLVRLWDDWVSENIGN